MSWCLITLENSIVVAGQSKWCLSAQGYYHVWENKQNLVCKRIFSRDSWMQLLDLQVCGEQNDLFIVFLQKRIILPGFGGCVRKGIFSQSKRRSENSGSCHELRGEKPKISDVTTTDAASLRICYEFTFLHIDF